MRHTILAISLLLLACTPQTQPQQTPDAQAAEFKIVTPFVELEPELVSYSAYSGIVQPVQTAITSQEEWNVFWVAHMAHVWNPGHPPQVDFDKNIVLAVLMGEQTTGGYEIRIDRVVFDQQKQCIRVYYSEYRPAPNAAALQSLTYPSYIVKVDKVPYKSIIFNKTFKKE